MAEARALAHQFDDLTQQREAATLGMWVFLVTEVMLFGGLFTGYTAYRWLYRPVFVMGSDEMEHVIGAVNTAVLIVSSLTMAQAVQASQLGRRRSLVRYLGATALLGTVFLVLKGVEYYQHVQDGLIPGEAWHHAGPRALEIFYFLYYAMTGLHAIHLTVGVFLVSGLLVLARRGKFSAVYHNPVEIIGLYWHLIDIVWIFLYPLFYLVK